MTFGMKQVVIFREFTLVHIQGAINGWLKSWDNEISDAEISLSQFRDEEDEADKDRGDLIYVAMITFSSERPFREESTSLV